MDEEKDIEFYCPGKSERMKITSVTEFDGSPDPLWYYTKGHIDKKEFLAELREQVGNPHSKLRSEIHPDCLPCLDANIEENGRVTHEWWHFFPCGEKDMGCWAQVEGPGRGNMAVTVYNVDYRMG